MAGSSSPPMATRVWNHYKFVTFTGTIPSKSETWLRVVTLKFLQYYKNVEVDDSKTSFL